MDDILHRILVDNSTDSMFQFSLACADCGEVWKSQPILFSKANQIPTNENKKVIFRALYEREKANAKMKAARQAKQTFNLCPICKQWVCNKCFLICTDLDMCSRCAERLEEQGEPVEKVYPQATWTKTNCSG